jgi:MFS family permease
MVAIDAPAAAERPSLNAWLSLGLLIAIGLYMYTDRQVLVLQTEPIRQQLGLSDFQVGLVQGLSVALFAAFVSYPLGWLADRIDRRFLLAGSIILWSVAVAACGLSRNFGELFFASAIVGIGEAGLLPITYAMIPELFRGQARLAANSMLILVGRLTVGFVIALCGVLVQYVGNSRPFLPPFLANVEDWRLALFVVAALGPLLAVLVFTIPASRSAAASGPTAAPRAPVWPFVWPQRITLLTFYAGVGLTVFGFSAVGAFLPVVAMRQMGATPLEVGGALGAATFVATAVGFVVTNLGMRAFGKRLGPNLPIRALMLMALFGGLTALLFLAAQTPIQLYIFFAIHLTIVMTGTMLFPAAIQDMSPAPMRARLISIIIMVNIILSAFAPAIVGAVSDQMSHLPNGLMLATVATAGCAFIIASLMLFICARGYGATIEFARRVEAKSAQEAPA